MRTDVLFVSGLILGALLNSCELFTTRAPEKPTGTSGEGWQFPSSPRVVVSNLESAVGRRSVVDYMKSLTNDSSNLPGFVFVPDPQTGSDFPLVFDNWNFESERRSAQSLFNSTNLPLDSLSLLETTIDRETSIGDSAQLTANYRIHIGHQRTTAPREMSGRMELKLLKGIDGGWYIQRWSDIRSAGSACWSDLKAHFR